VEFQSQSSRTDQSARRAAVGAEAAAREGRAVVGTEAATRHFRAGPILILDF